MSKTGNDEVSLYFNWYRRNKLINRYPSTTPYSVDFDGIDSRNKVIRQSGDCYAFWVDGCGTEWLPLLVSKLNKLSLSVKITAKVARCMLPSETKYNHKWGNADDKWDRLDKLSHAGMPDEKDYFLCIARQIEIIGEVVGHIEELLENHDSIIVTGDHGSSRLAALMFHVADNFAITPPKNAIVHSFGRFCEIKDTINVPTNPSTERVELNGETFIVMKTYEHFKQSGNAAGGNTDDNAIAGEIHGGMTPEEYLVPVIVISRKNPLVQHDKIENKRSAAANLNDIGI